MWTVRRRDRGTTQERGGFDRINDAKAFRDRLSPTQARGAVIIFLEYLGPDPQDAGRVGIFNNEDSPQV